ncbi:hypothetical protein AMAG_17653 [Allomyces macrogynus ATCC 38327]|uniref:Uncharacterized protein n=1 Tax=Allomyces macrogynus (strain ATCC 38327) TaxID=578462 RepID=A0A0L0RW47_ALLM3|nr:hypothetical protein AMAG_17653 [Allomyces macrogynus ATCC 38327]|eukprot:KNE54320.1 hypothetical protein AMAG_17653 [Allomyces macrogynus ATCC 38327]
MSETPSEDGHDNDTDQVPARPAIYADHAPGRAPAHTDTNEDEMAVVYLPDQLACMVHEPSALWWAPNVSDSVSPPLEAPFRDLFMTWEKRLVPPEVKASEWMRV